MGKILTVLFAFWIWFVVCAAIMFGIRLLVWPYFEWHWHRVIGLWILTLMYGFWKYQADTKSEAKVRTAISDAFKARRGM